MALVQGAPESSGQIERNTSFNALDLTHSGVNSAVKRSGGRAGITGADPKSVRQFAANEGKRAGYDMEEIQDTLGHSDISTTQGCAQKSMRRQPVVHPSLPGKPTRNA